MRRPLLISVLLLISGTAPAQVSRRIEPDPSRIFRAGAATSNITPPLGEPIVGGWTSPPATFIHDELHARCLVLDDGRTRLAIVVSDSVGIPRQVLDEARALVGRETGLPGSHLMLAATHTHSAATARTANPLVPDASPSEYQRFLARRIADGVRRAVETLEPAELGGGSVDVPSQVFNRRWFLKPGVNLPNPFGGQDKVMMNPSRGDPDLVEPAGPTDPEVSFLAVRSTGGRPIALLANYSLHYVGGVPEGHVSADYFAAFAEQIGRLIGADRLDPPFVGIMSNGTSGDVNNIDFRRKGQPLPPYQKIREVADEVAAAVHRGLARVEYRRQVPLAAAARDLVLAVRKPTEEQVAHARELLARPADARSKLPHERTYAERVMQLHQTPDRVSVMLQAFHVGDLGIAAIPFEVFAETGLAIKKGSPLAHTFTIELANGSCGYLPTPRHHALGGYETWLGTSRVEVEASDKIEREILGLLAEVKAKP